MKCTKPAGPYLAVLTVLFVLSMLNLPTGKTTDEKLVEQQLASEREEGGQLKQIENISMLNIKDHE